MPEFLDPVAAAPPGAGRSSVARASRQLEDPRRFLAGRLDLATELPRRESSRFELFPALRSLQALVSASMCAEQEAHAAAESGDVAAI